MEAAMSANEDTHTPNTTGVDEGLARHGGISYLHIPATDVQASAGFYGAVFGWRIANRDSPRPGFTDPTGHVGGAWVTDQAVAREPGLLLYIYVDHIDAAVARIEALGGQIVTAPHREGTLWVATFRDPAGNLLGIWQEGALTERGEQHG